MATKTVTWEFSDLNADSADETIHDALFEISADQADTAGDAGVYLSPR